MIYTQVSPDQIVSMTASLKSGGAMVTNPSTNRWTIVGNGVTANAEYHPSSQKLTVNVTSKPFFLPESFINTGILKALGRA